ncbi:MAG: DNA-directed RNA polymerase subunit alpha C-terminal domain-containing protein [Planctomycetota bacterium]|jgi:DNA-directed RNA polymerase subunit alpha|nr:DNA-directed RNA polymerase subunit alpha C-terminal domain-containing protein [Planctomycetota bacterium]
MNENLETPINPEAGDYISDVAAAPEETLPEIESAFTGSSIDREELFAARKDIFQHEKLITKLEGMLGDLESAAANASSPADKKATGVKLGFAQWILNDIPNAIATFDATSGDEASFMLSQVYLEQELPGKALLILEKLASKDDSLEVTCALIEARTKIGEAQKTVKEAEKLAKKNPNSPDAIYQQALALDFLGEYESAIENYEAALDRDRTHAKASFRLGYNLALRGQEKEAIACYQRCIESGPVHTSALTNLGLLYEDSRQYDKAVKCFQQVLAGDPTDGRARLFLKDAMASLNMEYDEEQHGEFEKRSDLLQQPVADFELSVRCRSALETIGIITISDLVAHTEQELLACKNFGETSLQEIKALLTAKNLGLGMTAAQLYGDGSSMQGGDGNMDKLVSDLDLSVRSRRCMERLGIVTVRDLMEKSERELLSGKNFGRTSLKELKDKLTELGLVLAEDS